MRSAWLERGVGDAGSTRPPELSWGPLLRRGGLGTTARSCSWDGLTAATARAPSGSLRSAASLSLPALPLRPPRSSRPGRAGSVLRPPGAAAPARAQPYRETCRASCASPSALHPPAERRPGFLQGGRAARRQEPHHQAAHRAPLRWR